MCMNIYVNRMFVKLSLSGIKDMVLALCNRVAHCGIRWRKSIIK